MRIAFYIDGFNVYHVIDEYCPKYKWLDLHKMVKSVIPASVDITGVYYFSALACWKPDRVKRHETYIKALNASGVSVILGRFKRKERLCSICNKEYPAHEEKQTDVNIALKMFEDAMDDQFDRAVIVSGDTDFVPIISTLRRRFVGKQIGVMLPIGSHASALKKVADFSIKMKRKHLTLNQFPEIVETPTGSISKPNEW